MQLVFAMYFFRHTLFITKAVRHARTCLPYLFFFDNFLGFLGSEPLALDMHFAADCYEVYGPRGYYSIAPRVL